MSNYTITDKNSNLYNFPDSFWSESQTDDNNTNVVNSAYTPGGRDIADNFFRSKTITLSGQLQYDSAAAFETGKRAFVQACIKGGDLRFTGDVVSRYLEVKLSNFDWAPSEGQQGSIFFQDVSVTFIAQYVFWKDNSLTDDDNTVAGNDSLTITMTGSDFLVMPIITIEADQAADIPSIRLTNNSDNGMQLIYNDPNFVIGDTLIINCATGEVLRNGTNTIQYFDKGFLRLQPGANSIEYEGAACTITFSYRKVYI